MDIFTRSFLFFIYLLLTISESQSYKVGEICYGTNNGPSATVNEAPEDRIASLRTRYAGCKYVEGNLEITGLNHADVYNKDLSFLNSITEVSGYVLIANVYVKNVTLVNLSIIRGSTLYHPIVTIESNGTGTISHSSTTARSRTMAPSTQGYSLYVSFNYLSASDSIGMRLLGLRSLAEISAGNVLFENNNLLCYATTDIYWPDILANQRLQKFRFNNDITSRMQPCKPGCHDSCHVDLPRDSGRYCWGPGPKNCQRMNKVTCAEQCDGERCFGTQSYKCCHAECAGGCDGPSKSDCWNCKNYYNDGGCEAYCPRQQIYDNTDFEWIPNPKRKFTFGKLCIKNCPNQYLEHKGDCVRSCPNGFEPKDDKSCIECTGGHCAKSCSVRHWLLYDYLNANNVDSLAGCTTIDGHLQITNHTFTGQAEFNIPPLPIEKLNILNSVKEITEYLQVHKVRAVNLTTLGFLSNLEKIMGHGTSEPSLYIIDNPYLESLGLTSLNMITGSISIENNPRLCYLDTFDWEGGAIKGTPKFRFHTDPKNGDEDKFCKPNNMTCHAECYKGCWGPGNTRCLQCRNANYKGHCLTDCTGPLLFNVPGSSECLDCHSECNSSCVERTARDCEACKNFRDGPYCVAECPKDFKYNNTAGVCQDCHYNCIQGCTGPGNFVGRGGCNICENSIANDDGTEIVRCLNVTETCPSGYFVNTNTRGPLSQLKDRKVCTKCHPLCAECEEKGNFHCTECLHYRFGDLCVRECGTGYYADELHKQCFPCHDNCRRECTGPTEWDCNHCTYYKVYNDSRPAYLDEDTRLYYNHSLTSPSLVLFNNITVSTPSTHKESPTRYFYCTERNICPDSAPLPNIIDADTVCTSADYTSPGSVQNTSSLPLEAIIGIIVAPIIVIIILAGCGTWVCMRRAREQERRLKWTQLMQGGARLEPIDPSSAAPDMSKLKLIKEIDLRRGGILGSGAFGTVYKGVWLPEGDNVKIPVAIKVLQEGNSPHQNKELLEEARVMASVEHPCCVRIVAVCMTEQMMLITQLMPLGCLLDYVKNNRHGIRSKVMLNWCTQIAKGMMYLESKGVVHRDLAARNVLVQSSHQVKITDFGLAKLLDFDEGEYHSAGGKMPIKWLALESIQHRRFTHKTDVWSYGVTLWEMFTYGQKPYETVRAWEVPELLEKGERLPQPTICTIDVYMIMIKCWMIDAESRPSFADLSDEFAKMSRDPERYLVIEGDDMMRLPSSCVDIRDMLGASTELLDGGGGERVMDAVDYLNMVGMRTNDSSITDITYANDDDDSTVVMMDRDVIAYRNGSLPQRAYRDNQHGSAFNMTYPRQHSHGASGHLNGVGASNSHNNSSSNYVNGFLSHDHKRNPTRKSFTTLDQTREKSQSASNASLRGNHTLNASSVSSLKPYKYTSDTDSLLCIDELGQDNAEPPDYNLMTPISSTNDLVKVVHIPPLHARPPPVYEDDYLQPRSAHSVYTLPAPPIHTPTTPREDKPRVFTFDISDTHSKPARMFANPEYFEADNLAAGMVESVENDLSNPLLPQNGGDYYNSVAAFSSDSSARDSFISA